MFLKQTAAWMDWEDLCPVPILRYPPNGTDGPMWTTNVPPLAVGMIRQCLID